MFLTGGNDDEPSVLEVLEEHEGEHVVAAEGKLIELDEEHTMITVGLSTPTPWDTPREVDEEGMEATLEAAVTAVPHVGHSVCNFHCPRKRTNIGRGLKA